MCVRTNSAARDTGTPHSEHKKLCRELGIRIVPTSAPAAPMCTKAGATIRNLLEQYGQDHVVTVLRAITEGNKANRAMLREDVIKAVSDIVRAHPGWIELGGRWLEAWDAVDLAQIRNSAKASGIGPLRFAIGAMVCLRLTEILGPSVVPKAKPIKIKNEPKPPRSVTRVPEVQAKVRLGVELLALRSTTQSQRLFGRLAREKAKDLGFRCMSATEGAAAMSVARRYADRPDITERVSFITLVALASPSLPDVIRSELEGAIIAGKRVARTDVIRARGPLPTGRPKQSAQRMAA